MSRYIEGRKVFCREKHDLPPKINKFYFRQVLCISHFNDNLCHKYDVHRLLVCCVPIVSENLIFDLRWKTISWANTEDRKIKFGMIRDCTVNKKRTPRFLAFFSFEDNEFEVYAFHTT